MPAPVKLTPDDLAWIARAVLDRATNREIADHIGVTVRTLTRWRSASPAFNAMFATTDRRTQPYPCGTIASYRRGCRCADCTSANTVYYRGYRNVRARRIRREERRRAELAWHDSPEADATTDVQIEQAIARGLTTSQIMARLGVTYADVAEVRQHMQEVA